MVESDKTLLLKIFPNEVWDIILENVKDAQTFQQIGSAALHFRIRLQPRASQVLFSKVFKVILEQNPIHSVKTNYWIVARQVCRSWKRDFDQLMQTPKYFTRNHNQMLSGMRGIGLDYDYLSLANWEFGPADRFAKFEAHFDPTHLANNMNPFVIRKLQLDIQSSSKHSDSYVASFLQFLHKYGRHIWTCRLGFILQSYNTLVYYNRTLKSALELMPNMRALQIRMICNFTSDKPYPVNAAPWPKLPHLEYFGMRTRAVRLLYPFVLQLLESNTQTQYVDIMDSPATLHDFQELLPNLRALAFTIRDSNQIQGFTNAQFTGRVERLWIKINWPTGNVEPVFQALKVFSGSLLELHLKIPDNEKLGAEAKLVLPRLKTIHLEMKHPQRLDLLLPLKDSLEELYLVLGTEPNRQVNSFEFTTPSEDKNQYKFELYKFWKEPQKSNIWFFFPNLKALEIISLQLGKLPEQYSCNRNQWETEMKAQNP